MSTLTGTPTDAASMPPGFQVRAEPQELTLEKLVAGATIYDLPIRGFAHVFDAMKEIFELSWERWPPTILVNQILVAAQGAPGANPPQTVTTSVTVFGLGFRPGVPVNLKWNNAWGFPGTSVALPDGVPDSNGRFSLILHHTVVPKSGKDWVWEQNNQLVLVAQQRRPNGSIEFQDDYRPIPPHVLWQWIP